MWLVDWQGLPDGDAHFYQFIDETIGIRTKIAFR